MKISFALGLVAHPLLNAQDQCRDGAVTGWFFSLVEAGWLIKFWWLTARVERSLFYGFISQTAESVVARGALPAAVHRRCTVIKLSDEEDSGRTATIIRLFVVSNSTVSEKPYWRRADWQSGNIVAPPSLHTYVRLESLSCLQRPLLDLLAPGHPHFVLLRS